MPTLEYKQVELDVKAFDAETGAFEGYAAVFGNVDRVGDRLEAGAVANLDELVRRGSLLWQHDSREVVGFLTRAEQDAYGLKVWGQFHQTPRAQEVRTILLERTAAGKPTPMSIGYVPKDYYWETSAETGEVRVLKRIEVYEVSFVVVGANPLAQGEAKHARIEPRVGLESLLLTLALHTR